MDTKSLIKETARQLFNARGLMNITLREVAEKMDKSYGNITYHYPSKEALLLTLFDELNEELSALQERPEGENLLRYFLHLPELNYSITLKYLFFTSDSTEIFRNYPNLFARIMEMNMLRREKWLQHLKNLLADGYLNSDLGTEDLNYILFLSASVRSSYFQFTDKLQYSQAKFVQTVNLLLKPYLSDKGLKVYREFIS